MDDFAKEFVIRDISALKQEMPKDTIESCMRNFCNLEPKIWDMTDEVKKPEALLEVANEMMCATRCFTICKNDLGNNNHKAINGAT